MPCFLDKAVRSYLTGQLKRKTALLSPLPIRNGVAASRVWLPEGPWLKLADFLLERFVHLPANALLARLEQGDIVDQHGCAQGLDSQYQALRWLWYYREVPDEASLPIDLPILFQDRYLVVVDKPHFLASTPGGSYLQQTALIHLRRELNLPLLIPIHRLDRDTAGVLLFCADPDSRGAYHTLFQSREVSKEYEAIAPLHPNLDLPLHYRSRLQQPEGGLIVQEVAGSPNSDTHIALISAAAKGHYLLRPVSGRKHQLRVHMAALGMAICNDRLYPALGQPWAADDFQRPLQLLARSIAFTDPLSGAARKFSSQRKLAAIGLCQ